MLRPIVYRPIQLSRAASGLLRTVTAPCRAPTILRVPEAPVRVVHRIHVGGTSSIRHYSTEAAEQRVEIAEDGPPAQFRDLLQLGVNPALVDVITRRLGFNDMTDVQSKTIRPALAGKDL